MRSLFLILLLIGLTAPAAAQYKGRVIGGAPAAAEYNGRVIGGAPVALEGDSLLVTPECAPAIRVRLWGIDTSDMKDAPWTRQARDALGDFLDWSRRVQCRVVDHDTHELPIARCVTTGPGAAGGKDLVH